MLSAGTDPKTLMRSARLLLAAGGMLLIGACSVSPNQRPPCEARQPCDCDAGVSSTAVATASSSTPARSRPKPAPSRRSGSESGVAWISMRISRASTDQATKAPMKARMKAAPSWSPEPGVPTGR